MRSSDLLRLFQAALLATTLHAQTPRDPNSQAKPAVARRTPDNARLEATVSRMLRQNLTLEAALNREPRIGDLITGDIRKITWLAIDGTHPALKEAAHQIKLNEIFAPDGKLRKDTDTVKAKVGGYIAANIWNLPIGEFSKPSLDRLRAYLRDDASARFSAGDNTAPPAAIIDKLFDFSLPAWKVASLPESQVRVGDMFDRNKPHTPGFDAAAMLQTFMEIRNEITVYAGNHALAAVKADPRTSVYDYVLNPKDPLGAVTDVVFADDPFVGYLNRSFGIVDSGGKSGMPQEVIDHLKKVPLSTVLGPDGNIRDAVLRDDVITPIKDKKVVEVEIDFAGAIGSEIGTVWYGFAYNSDNANLLKALTETKMGSFISGGDPDVFEKKQRDFGAVWPMAQRAFDITRYTGNNGATNPWRADVPAPPPPTTSAVTPAGSFPPALANSGAGGRNPAAAMTVIPLSFDIKDNKIIPQGDITDVHELNDTQRGRVLYAGWHWLLGTCATIEEVKGAFPQVETSPGVKGPRGILVYGANESKTAANGNPDELGTAGNTLGAFNPNGDTRVDIALHDIVADKPGDKARPPNQNPNLAQSYAADIHVIGHELGNHALNNQNHPQDALIPGTIDVAGIHTVRYFDTDLTEASYTPGRFRMKTETVVDKRIAISAFGSCPVMFPGNTVTLQAGTDNDIARNRNPLIGWVGLTEEIGQVVLTPPGATLDFRAVGKDLVSIDSTTPLDLRDTAHIFTLHGLNIPHYRMTRLDTLDPVNNAIATEGKIIAGPQGTIQLTDGGTLDASTPGSQTLIGGDGGGGKKGISTRFIGGPGQKTFVINGGRAEEAVTDLIQDYRRGNHIVAPVTAVTAKASATISEDPNNPSQHLLSWQVKFLDGSGRTVKSVVVEGTNEARLPLAAITVTTADGRPLVPEQEPVFPGLIQGVPHAALRSPAANSKSEP